MNRQDLFDKNMKYFEEVNQGLFMRLSYHEPHAQLTDDTGEGPDLAMGDKLLYGKGGEAFADLQWERFWQEPSRLGVKPIQSDNVDEEGERFLGRIMRRALDEEITFTRRASVRRSFHVICLGLGLGFHLDRLAEETACRNLLIIEPNFEFVYQSLFTFDWRAFAEACAARGGSRFHLITAPRPQEIIHEIRLLHRTHGVCYFDSTVVYEHYKSSAFDSVQLFLTTEADMMFAGIGFLEDEFNMLANSYRNLKDGRERVFEKFQINDSIPALIVGSGPSLDSNIEEIKRLSERALVISCGTALAPLLRAGIQPDFQAELERDIAQVVFPRELMDEGFDLSETVLVGSTTMLPESRGNFPKRVYYFREQLSCFPVFSGDQINVLKYPSPTVTNTGISFAQEIGIRSFYLFGTDFGFRETGRHHSGTTQYESFDMGADREFKGNFGGTFLSTFVYGWAKDAMENSIKAINMGRSYYNCSDGSRVDNTIPVLADQVELPPLGRDKKAIVNDIVRRFPVYNQERFDRHWQDGVLIEEVEDMVASFVRAIEEHPDLYDNAHAQGIMDVIDFMDSNRRAQSLAGGSIMQVLMVGDYYLSRVQDPAKRALFSDIVREEYIRIFTEIAEDVRTELTGLQENGRLPNRESGYVWYRGDQSDFAENVARDIVYMDADPT